MFKNIHKAQERQTHTPMVDIKFRLSVCRSYDIIIMHARAIKGHVIGLIFLSHKFISIIDFTLDSRLSITDPVTVSLFRMGLQ